MAFETIFFALSKIVKQVKTHNLALSSKFEIKLKGAFI